MSILPVRHGLLVTLLIIVTIGAGCASPTRPSHVVPVASGATPVSTIEPALLTVTSIAPTAGSTAGGTWGVIAGAGFQNNAVVRIGDEVVRIFVESSSSIRFWTTAHAAAVVDVEVLNSPRQSATLPRAFSYATPGSFDFNGDWIAHAGNDFEADMRFTIRNNLLTSVSCAGLQVPLAPGASVLAGEFSFSASEGSTVTGRLVSPTTASGTIDIAPCASRWWADKIETARLLAPPHEH